jgi:hypothetical protein
MADAALMVSWNGFVRGREPKSFQLFGEIVIYFGGLQQTGMIESFEPVLLDPQRGEPMGFVLIRGEAQKLAQLRASDDFQRLLMKVSLIVEGLSLQTGKVGAGIAATIGMFQQALQDLSA